MLFTITGKHIDITEAIKKHAEEKTSKLPKYYNSVKEIEVIVDGNGAGDISVEIIVRTKGSRVFVVTETGEDAYQCIDIAVHKLERQLRKRKERQRNNKHINGS